MSNIIITTDIINHQTKLHCVIDGKIYEEIIDFGVYDDQVHPQLFLEKIRDIKIKKILTN